MRRALKLVWLSLRTSLVLGAQYRSDFFLDAGLGLFWVAAAVMPLFVVYGEGHRAGIPGWTFGETLIVVGFFITLQAVLEGAINPSLTAVVDHIRKGTLDFILLKPADAQFLVSTSRFQPWKVAGLFHAGVVFTLGFREVGRLPSIGGVATALLLLGVAAILLYSLWILIVSTAFYVVKVDNLTYLFTSVFDAARWPATVFRGALRVLFTFIIPLTVMTTYPAEALLGRLEWANVGYSLIGAAVFAAVARTVWLFSLSRYTSAGG